MGLSSTLSSLGIVIRTFPSSEHDLIARAITEQHGKIALLARNLRQSKKRFGTQIDLFDMGLFTFKPGRGGLYYLEGFSPRAVFRKLREGIANLTAASVVCECFDLLVREEDQDSAMYYRLLLESLRSINEAARDREVMRQCYLALRELLQQAGFGTEPEMQREPSAKHLLELLRRIEALSEKPLNTKNSLLNIFQEMKQDKV